MHSFETRPGKSTQDPADPGLKPGRVKKIREVKNPAEPTSWPGKTWSKTGFQFINYLFF